MKKFSLLALAAAGMLLGACSDKDAVVSDANQSNPYGLIEGESSWLALGISMPGDAITRGITRANEDLTDGIEDEFKVYSGTLYLFKGENEDEATFFGSYPIDPTFHNEAADNVPEENSLNPEGDKPGATYENNVMTEPGYGEITSTSQKFVQEIENPSLGVNDKLYAYVILNTDNNATGISATTNSTTGAQFKRQQLKAIGIVDESNGFGSIYTTTVGEKTKGGLVMTNVPISTVAGGETDPDGADIITFTEINKNAVYKTKAEAQGENAQIACIYVERAAAKVEVRVASDFGIQLDGENNVTTISPSDVKWTLGNVNFGGTHGTGEDAIVGVGYYNTRQFNTSWLSYNNLVAPDYLRYRMVGRTRFFNANHTPMPAFRTYFGEDPNYTYSGTGTGTIPYDANNGLLYAQLQDNQYTFNPSTDTDPVVTYTYENTFDENSQIYRNTTYVGVKVKIAANDFYTIEGQPNTKLANNAAIKAVVETRLRDAINTKIANITSAITTDLGKTTGRTISADVTKVTFNIAVTVNEGTYNGTTGELPYTVSLALADVKTTISGTAVAASTEDLAAINALAHDYIGIVANPANSKVYKYVGGVAYYSARIQHFGDTETPWGAPAEAYNVYQAADPTPCVYPANGQQTFGTPATLHNYGSNHANAWLGRWGVVRNNWYVLTLKKIEGIGSPVPEDFNGTAGNTPDDNPKPSYFIAAEVHILPWVKRTQEVTF